jgi:hypothetical protein
MGKKIVATPARRNMRDSGILSYKWIMSAAQHNPKPEAAHGIMGVARFRMTGGGAFAVSLLAKIPEMRDNASR